MAKRMSRGKIKVLLAAPGLDCHERTLWTLADAFKRAGMEVVYLGIFQTPERIVESAIDEDVDVIALSYALDHLYMIYFPKVVELLRQKGATEILVVGGGHISEEDKPKLLEKGITGLYGPGTPLSMVINHITERVDRERGKTVS
jgi:methylmalonyl-CoA mutase C-terminal domain/subunit